jgi:hypothetical protein
MDLAVTTIDVYLRRALDEMAKALDRFDDRSVNTRPHGSGTNSAAALVTHACSAATFWFDHIGMGRPSSRARDSEFEATATVAELRELITVTADDLSALAVEIDTGPTAIDHELRVFLPKGDESDASIVLHVLEELYQHLGHLELTADALSRS